jgi:hypothetical protein
MSVMSPRCHYPGYLERPRGCTRPLTHRPQLAAYLKVAIFRDILSCRRNHLLIPTYLESRLAGLLPTRLLHVAFLARPIFDPEDGRDPQFVTTAVRTSSPNTPTKPFSGLQKFPGNLFKWR